MVDIKEKKLIKSWEFTTSSLSWGGGAGWTGQPVIVKWPDKVKKIMNIKEKFKNKKDFVEVIYGSLDGKIYFFDLESGELSRKPISIKNPIKGSVSIDPRGYPLLYVGQGIPETGKIGYRIFNLINGKLLYFINGIDSIAFRKWGAFDGSALINRNTDTFILGGENGLFYFVKLNTNFDINKGTIKINPKLIKYRYKIKNNNFQGIENSVAAYRNVAYFADNGGSIQAIDLTTLSPIWALEKSDDIDATITLEIDNGIPYLYSGTEVDKQGKNGMSIIRKLNGLNGKIVWKKEYRCLSVKGKHPINGGMFATNVIGKKEIKNIVIFTLARYKNFNSSLMVALDKKTGKEIWRWEMKNYSWSSPVDIYSKNGKAYIIQCDSKGYMYLIKGKTGKIVDKIDLKFNIESSPAVYTNYAVIATRGDKIYCVKIT
ncbi:PQQ-binding-like beta-propeller repeat protein [Thermohalobacter berrensis]|uniref:outer membrane protein assembly factor BamB family protein n=1 Tax=Thermohalobacter berrensis TaxID=99594 RepID=UPI0015FFF1EE|nr:PQQ-binding-like beta-propeller repeat protein [Thermohalobacter berrensis]